MFWKKKKIAAAPVSAEPTVAAGVAPSATKLEVTPQPKAEKPKVERLPGPKPIPGLVGKRLVQDFRMDPDLVNMLKTVMRKSSKTERAFDCRIFDESEVEARRLQIKDYTALDEHPDLILYEGWFDEEAKRVELEEKKKVSYDVPLLTETEIQQKIEALSEPDSTVFFYQARGPAVGGPLGRGAVIVGLNPDYSRKKGKKYIVSTANVIGMEPVVERNRLLDSDKPKELAKWIKEAHHKRMY
jgi:hypothetical protein